MTTDKWTSEEAVEDLRNEDPLSGEAGDHPGGAGVGSALGGGIAGAAAGVIGGPIGAVAGAVVGGVGWQSGGRKHRSNGGSCVLARRSCRSTVHQGRLHLLRRRTRVPSGRRHLRSWRTDRLGGTSGSGPHPLGRRLHRRPADLGRRSPGCGRCVSTNPYPTIESQSEVGKSESKPTPPLHA